MGALFWSCHPQAVKQVRARHLAFTVRNAALGKVHKAFAYGTFHSDQAEVSVARPVWLGTAS